MQSLKSVAEELQVNTRTVRNWIRVGILSQGKRIRLCVEKIGGRIRVPRESINQFKEELRPNPAAGQPEAPKVRSRKKGGFTGSQTERDLLLSQLKR